MKYSFKFGNNNIMQLINNRDFFKVNTVKLAQNLIGKWIVTNIDNKIRKAQILETEAYLGIDDSACHTYNGLKSKRTEPMWQEEGTIYIYLCYGLHYLFNIVTGDTTKPEAVLIRAVTNANGPAKTTNFLNIDKRLNGQSIINNSKIYLMDDGKKYLFKTAKRVGIKYALEKDRNALLRFILV